MQAAQADLRDVLEEYHEPALVVDPGGAIRFANAAAHGLFGYRPPGLRAQPLKVVLPGLRETTGKPGQGISRATSVSDEYRVQLGQDRNGRPLPLEVRRVPVPGPEGHFTIWLLREPRTGIRRKPEVPRDQPLHRRTLDAMLEGCQVIGLDWRYLYVNEAVCRQGRRRPRELLGRTMMQVYPGIDATPMFESLRRCMDARQPATVENEFQYPDGSTGWFELSIQPVPAGVLILSIDITARKRAELENARQLRHLRALREIDLAILRSGPGVRRDPLSIVIDCALAELAVDAAAILLLNPETQMLEYGTGGGFLSEAVQTTRLAVGRGTAGRSARDRQTRIVYDLTRCEDRFLRQTLIEQEQVLGYQAVPLQANGEVHGVLELFHRHRLPPDYPWGAFRDALAGQAAIAIAHDRLTSELIRAHRELRDAYDTTIEGWSRALDLRDQETLGHTMRVTEMTCRLARAVGMTDAELVHVRRGALLHDIGKMGVPDAILLKAGPLTTEEMAIMRRHPEVAYELLRPVAYLERALDIPYCHHEKWDGSGYPRGLAGTAIPLAARLFAVVDVWDALRSDRPYRVAWSDDRVADHLRAEAGRHFDPRAVDAFFQALAVDP